MEQSARVFDIQKFSLQDGPGIRTTVFFKGCNLRCAWCHNPEGMEYAIQQGAGDGKTYGFDISLEKLLGTVLEDEPFYRASGGGVTCSGGECMLQAEFLREFLCACGKSGVHTAVDTAGNVPWSSFQRLLPYTQLFLYDLKVVDSRVHARYTGADNSRILENLGRLAATGANIWLRIPVIEGVNSREEEIREMARLLQRLRFSQRIDLFAYHTYGRKKFQELNGREQALFSPPGRETLTRWGDILREVSPDVHITG